MAKYINADKLIKALKEQHAEIVKKIASAKTMEEKEKLKRNSENVANLVFLLEDLKGEEVFTADEVDQIFWERDLAIQQLRCDYGVGFGEKKNPDCEIVVRCKNCNYKEKATVNDKGFLICPASGMEITDEDFCSYGVRRDSDKR